MPKSPCLRAALAAIVLVAPSVSAQAIASFRVASGLARPVYVGAPRGDTERVFVIEQWEARIRIIKNGVLLATPFLDLPTTTVINSGNERGLLGLAFDPGYAVNGHFYLNYNNPSGHTVIARFTRNAANPDLADIGSQRIIQLTAGVTTYSYTQPFSNHNGGWMDFGPDNYLYISAGDGGSGGDPQGNGQNLNALLGKILRIDVNNNTAPFYFSPPTNPFFGPTAGRDEIWAYGVRNPWRCSFDRLTGELYIGDVGQNAVEEVSYGPNPTTAGAGGRNYGWNCREGNNSYAGCTPANYFPPIYSYPQGSGTSQGFCVTGGVVYRGCAIPGLEGTYFFGDYTNSRLWSFRYGGGVVSGFTDRTSSLQVSTNGATLASPSSFGEDGVGEIYVCDHGGEVFKIVPATGNTAQALLTLGGTPTNGTTVNLNLSSPSDPNRSFVLAMSLGIDPGIPLGDGREVQLAVDPVFVFTLDPLCPVLSGHYGTLNGSGAGTVQFIIPPDPALVNLRVYAAYVTLLATAPSGINRISCPLPITIL